MYVASSSPVRHVDQFARPRAKELRVLANRGVSGIDGTIASAIGASEGSGQRVVLIIGDLAFYHDMNSLLGLQRGNAKLTIVLLNNDGGGIFHRLPIREFEPPFERLFLTPHDLEFKPAAEMFGLRYQKITSPEELETAYLESLASDDSQLIEIPTDAALHEKIRLEIMKSIEV
jgi:2-succinyl-5-enolpyruvyl-6-hydroxy-3-cyclohexene-1-carboxylate synthase